MLQHIGLVPDFGNENLKTIAYWNVSGTVRGAREVIRTWCEATEIDVLWINIGLCTFQKGSIG